MILSNEIIWTFIAYNRRNYERVEEVRKEGLLRFELYETVRLKKKGFKTRSNIEPDIAETHEFERCLTK